MKRILFALALGVVPCFGVVSALDARPVLIAGTPSEPCDFIAPNGPMHELGWGIATVPPGPFPVDQEISSVSTLDQFPPCPVANIPGIPETRVAIANLTGKSWVDLWFVSDQTFGFTNIDALVAELAPIPGPPGIAFRIDNLGFNVPLVAGDDGDLVFEPSETWHFIVQDWVTPGSVSFGSFGVGGASIPDLASNASIIAVEFVQTPEPLTLALLGAGLVGLGVTRHRRQG
jgi:hypothetical protein